MQAITELIRGVAGDQDAVRKDEDVRKDGVWCHRQIFSQWWEEMTRQPVNEVA